MTAHTNAARVPAVSPPGHVPARERLADALGRRAARPDVGVALPRSAIAPAAMKIATFNVNGITARLPRLLEWLEEARPDVACLQELKTSDETFPADGAARPPATARSGTARRASTASPCSPAATTWSSAGAACPATPTTPTAATSRRRRTASSWPRSTCRTATRSRGRSSTTSWRGSSASPRMRRALFADARAGRARRRLQRGRDRRGRRHLLAALVPQRRAAAAGDARRRIAACSPRAGPIRSSTCIRASRSTRTGTTSATASRATPACASTTCC